jgi:hypothetical protein
VGSGSGGDGGLVSALQAQHCGPDCIPHLLNQGDAQGPGGAAAVAIRSFGTISAHIGCGLTKPSCADVELIASRLRNNHAMSTPLYSNPGV